jgi:hypothetical protein
LSSSSDRLAGGLDEVAIIDDTDVQWLVRRLTNGIRTFGAHVFYDVFLATDLFEFRILVLETGCL